MKYNIVTAKAYVDLFAAINDGDKQLRSAFDRNIKDLDPKWFVSNKKVQDQNRPWGEMDCVYEDVIITGIHGRKTFTHEFIPIGPDYVVIAIRGELATYPNKSNGFPTVWTQARNLSGKIQLKCFIPRK